MTTHESSTGLSARARGLVTLAAVLIAGVLAGAALDRTYIAYVRTPNVGRAATEPPTFGSRRRGGGVESGGGERIPTAFAGLDLTPEQESEIRAIAEHLRPITDSLWQQVRPRAMAAEVQMFRESACVLTPAQLEKFKAYAQRVGATQAQLDERLALVTSRGCPRRGH